MKIPQQVNENYQKPLVMVAQNTPVVEAIAQMYQAPTSCVLVIDQQKLIGIFTATDVIKIVANQVSFADMTIGELMSQPVITINEEELEDLPAILQRFHQYQIGHLPIIDDQGKVLGVITPEEVKTEQLKQMSQLLSQRDTQYHASKTRLNDILNSAIAISIVGFRVFPNYDWEYDYQSLGDETIFGYTSEEILQDKTLWISRVHPEDVETVFLPLYTDIFAGRISNVTYRFYHKNGSLLWISTTYASRYDAEGNCWVVTGTSVDISEHKQAEETLRHSEARLAESQQVARLGNWEHELTTGKISWSKGLIDLFGYDSSFEVPYYDKLYQLFHPEDWQQLHQAIERSFTTGEAYKLVLRAFKADGSIMYIEGIGHAQFNSQGEIIRLYGTAQDITEQQIALFERHQAEAALRESERRFRGIFNNTFHFTGLLTVDGILLEANQTALNFAGITSEEAINRPFWETHWWTISPETQAQLRQAIALAGKGEFIRYEVDVLGANNKVATIDFSLRPLRDETEKVVLLIPEGRDISEQQAALRERQRAERELQEKEHFLRSIYDGVANSIFVVDVVDGDFRFMGLNPAHERLTGLMSSELQGKTPEQVLPPVFAASVRQHYQDCVDAGETITYEECLPFQEQETWWITSLTPLQDEDLRVYRIIGSSINITQQKRTQQMLELQAVITRNMAEGLCLVRADDGIIVYANPKFKQIFGYEGDELIGQHISIINYEDDSITAQGVHEAIASAVIQYGEATYEVQNIKKDGTPFWCRATTSVFEHPEYGTVFVAVQQDITEQRQVEKKNQASLREKEVLLKEIHHRVKNNLGIVSSLLQMQCRRTQDDQATTILRDSQNRIASIALVHEKLYRSDDLANINFAEYIPDLTTHLFDSYNVSSNHIQLSIQVDDVSLDIETAIPCGLIINELVSNALKYAFPDNRQGEIQVRLYQQNEQTFTLIVRDNGIGLPVEFDISKAKTLGITLVLGLVKQLRGKLEIQSQSGTEFKINLTKSRV